MVEVRNTQFCGSREPECLRHMVHWHTPFWISMLDIPCLQVKRTMRYHSRWPVGGERKGDGEADCAAETAAGNALWTCGVCHCDLGVCV